MKIAFHNRYEALNPAMFVVHNAPIGDDLLRPFVTVREEAIARGHQVGTIDTMPDADALVFVDVPLNGSPAHEMMLNDPRPKFLVAFENRLVLPWNYMEWARFKRVMTWNDALVKWYGTRCVKLNYAQSFVASDRPMGRHERFAAIVCGNKFIPSIESLYPERERAITWFERNAPGALDLFGPGWQARRSWKGVIPPGEKRRRLAEYRFSIVFENAREPGYITEKLFDALIAGTVPVYLGAPNVEDYVPRTCFIDALDFCPGGGYGGVVDYALLYSHLVKMDEDKVEAYRTSAREWMDSDASKPFRLETFAKTVIDTVVGG